MIIHSKNNDFWKRFKGTYFVNNQINKHLTTKTFKFDGKEHKILDIDEVTFIIIWDKNKFE